MSECACGTGRAFEDCCAPVIRGERVAADPQTLLRARYSAHTTGDIDFVIDSAHPASRDSIDRAATARWAAQSHWQGLDILALEHPEGGDRAQIEFVARYRDRRDTPQRHHELAQFEQHNGRWYFRDASAPAPSQQRRDGPKVGRNEPCPCGSGKKYKKCHGAAA